MCEVEAQSRLPQDGPLWHDSELTALDILGAQEKLLPLP